MSKQLTLKQVKDNKLFLLTKGGKFWKMVGKNKNIATIQSQGGSTRFKPLSTKVFLVS